MSAQDTRFATLIRVCGVAPVIGGRASPRVSVIAVPGYDGTTRFGRLEAVGSTQFRLSIYEDRARTILFAQTAAKNLDDPRPWTLTMTPDGADPWTFGVSAFIGPEDFTLFGGNDPQAGLRGGCFAWITGPGYDGLVPFDNPPTNPNTGEPVTVWTPGMISADGLGEPTNEVEFSNGGSYGVMSGGQIKVPNSVPETLEPGSPVQTLTSFLEERGISFTKAEVSTFIVIDNAFQQWAATIAENPQFSELEAVVPLQDPHPFIHGMTPKQVMDRQTYSTMPADNAGKTMPLAIGYVLAKYLALSSATQDLVLANDLGKGTRVTRASAWDGAALKLTLITPGLSASGAFVADDPRLIGALVAVALAGTSGTTYYAARIKGNAATSGNATVLALSDKFLETTSLSPATPDITTTSSAWWFRVFSLTDFRVVSEGAVNDIMDGPYGLLAWSGSDFEHVYQRFMTGYPSGGYQRYPTPAGTEMVPVFSLLRDNPIISTQAVAVTAIYVSGFSTAMAQKGSVISVANRISDTFPAPGASASVLVDRISGGGYTRAWSDLAPNAVTTFIYCGATPPVQFAQANPTNTVAMVDMVLPDGFVLDAEEKMLVGIDFDVFLTSQSTGSGVSVYNAGFRLSLVDPLGAVIATGTLMRLIKDVLGTLDAPGPSGKTFSYRALGGEFYRDAASSWNLSEADPSGIIYTFLRSSEMVKAGLRLRVEFLFDWYTTYTMTGGSATFENNYTILQIGIFRKSDSAHDDLYQSVVGVQFGSDWGARIPPRNADDPVLAIGDAMEYLIRKQDLRPDYIDADSFDAFRSFRPIPTWFGGIQMLDSRNTFDWLQGFARESFSVIYPGHNGRRRIGIIERYFDAAAHPEPFLEFSDVQAGTMAAAEVGLLDRVFTAIDIKYDRNPATDDYRRRIQTLNEDKTSFPTISETMPGSSPAVPLWTLWVTGLDAFDLNGNVVYSGPQYEANYAAAKSLWEKCRRSYLRVGQRQVYEVEAEYLRAKVDWFPGTLSSTEDAAFTLALFVADYLFALWVLQEFSVPLTQETAAILPMQRIGYGDEIRTDGGMYYALVKRVALDTAGLRVHITAARRLEDTPYRMIDHEPEVLEVLQDVLDGEAEEYQDEQNAETVWRDSQ